MDKEEKYLGYLKYSGKSVESGLLDAKKSAEALLGFDEILRYFLAKEDPSLTGLNFEIPVRIKNGSWEIAIPEIIDKLLSPGGVLTVATGTYLTATAKKAADDGLFKTGLAKDIKTTFKAAIKSAQWVIKIGSRIGMLRRKYEGVRVSSNAEDFLVPDVNGDTISVPKKYFNLYSECPAKLFSRNVKIVDDNKILEVGLYEDGKDEKVKISKTERDFFYSEDGENEVLFPELTEGQRVELEGIITRGNEKTNTIGFEYKEHILTCVPKDGNIADYKYKIISPQKDHFFPKVKIIGVVERISTKEEFKQDRPRVIFSEIILLEKKDDSPKLFN